MALAVASTVVLMRMLVDQDRLSTRAGHVAVGWLIVEDLFTVVALVVLPVLAIDARRPSPSLGMPLLLALGKAAAFAAIVWVVGSRVVGALMDRMARTRSEELFTLAVFVLALGIAVIAAEGFHVSVALGAFFAGLVVGQSRFGPQASSYMTPFRDVFSALFFVSVGMLFNPSFVLAHPLMVLAALAVVLVVKPAVALAIVVLMRAERGTAATVAVGLAQIGEFSFILATLGLQLGILPPEGLDALVVAAIFSIALNPMLFRALRRFEARATRPARPRAEAEAPASPPPPADDGDRPLTITGSGELTQRVIARCLARAYRCTRSARTWTSSRKIRARRGHRLRQCLPRRRADGGRRRNRAGVVVSNPVLIEKMAICARCACQSAGRDRRHRRQRRRTRVARGVRRDLRLRCARWPHRFGDALDPARDLTAGGAARTKRRRRAAPAECRARFAPARRRTVDNRATHCRGQGPHVHRRSRTCNRSPFPVSPSARWRRSHFSSARRRQSRRSRRPFAGRWSCR